MFVVLHVSISKLYYNDRTQWILVPFSVRCSLLFSIDCAY